MEVECSNCGGVGPAFWLALGAFVVALGALIVNLREHRVFMRTLSARARFKIDVETLNAGADGVVRSDASTFNVRVAIEIKNVGDKAAGETLINVIVPRQLRVRWCGAQGEEVSFGSLSPTPEILTASTGREYEAQYLDHRIARINRRPVYRRHFQFQTAPPSAGQEGELSITPIRVTVQADDLPDDQDEISVRHEVKVGRPD